MNASKEKKTEVDTEDTGTDNSNASSSEKLVMACSKTVRMSLQTLLLLIRSSIEKIPEEERGDLETIKNQIGKIKIRDTKQVPSRKLVSSLYEQYRIHRDKIEAGIDNWENYEDDDRENLLIKIGDKMIGMKIINAIEGSLSLEKGEGTISPRDNFRIRTRILFLRLIKTFAEYEKDEGVLNECNKRIKAFNSKLGLSIAGRTDNPVGSLMNGLQESGISDIMTKFLSNPDMQNVVKNLSSGGKEPGELLNTLSNNSGALLDAVRSSLPKDMDTGGLEEQMQKIKDAMASGESGESGDPGNPKALALTNNSRRK